MNLKAVAQEGECQEVEFKEILELDTDGKKREFAKDISAMANSTEREGLIIIGITKNGKITGITKNPALIERAQQVNSSRCSPPVKFFSEWIRYDGKDILVLRLPRSERVPYAVDKTDVYVRRETIIEKATPNEIYELQHRSSKGSREAEEVDISEPLYIVEEYSPMFYPLFGSPQAYRTTTVKRPYAGPGACPVFMPHYGLHVTTPEIGETKSAVMFAKEPESNWYSRDSIRAFLSTLEARVQQLSDRANAWRVYPMSWGLSGESQFSYGLSATNAISALENIRTGLFAAVFQFERVSLYKPTGWLALLCEIRDHEDGRFYIRNFGMKLLLSSIPIATDWVEYLLSTTNLLSNRKIETQRLSADAVLDSMYTLHWEPSEHCDTEVEVMGMLGRDTGPEPDYDDGLGITVRPNTFHRFKFELDHEESWNADSYKVVFDKTPLECFDEILMDVTNPVPHWIDLKQGRLKVGAPIIKMALIGLAGHLILPINIRSIGAW